MNFVQILECCPSELYDVISIIKFVINVIRWAIPIILILLCILDIAKIVTAGNIDDKIRLGEEIKLSDDDMIFISSDGITDMLLNDTLAKLFKDYPDRADGILKEVAKTWADDNCTVIMIK